MKGYAGCQETPGSRGAAPGQRVPRTEVRALGVSTSDWGQKPPGFPCGPSLLLLNAFLWPAAPNPSPFLPSSLLRSHPRPVRTAGLVPKSSLAGPLWGRRCSGLSPPPPSICTCGPGGGGAPTPASRAPRDAPGPTCAHLGAGHPSTCASRLRPAVPPWGAGGGRSLGRVREPPPPGSLLLQEGLPDAPPSARLP